MRARSLTVNTFFVNCDRRVEIVSLTMATIRNDAIGVDIDPVLRPSQMFVAKLDVELSPNFVPVNKDGMAKFSAASRSQFKDFVESTIKEMIKNGGVFFEMIKLAAIFDTIKEDIKDLANWGHRVANDDHLIYSICVKQFTRILNSIASKSAKVLNRDQANEFSRAIKKMIKVIETRKDDCPKLRTGIGETIKKPQMKSSVAKSRTESTIKESPSMEPTFMGTKPSEQFVENLSDVAMFTKESDFDNVLIAFTDSSAQKFTNYIESQVDSVLKYADFFFKWVLSHNVQTMIGEYLLQLRTCVHRVSKNNYDRYSQFSSLFTNLMTRIIKRSRSRCPKPVRCCMEKMLDIVRRSGQDCPKLVRRSEVN